MASPTTDRRLGLVGNTAIKAPVDCATTGNITLEAEQTIDGVATQGSRVLVKNQSNPLENGIYRTNTGQWTREPDADGNYDIANGTMVLVTAGSQALTAFICTSANPITPGSTPLNFAQSANPAVSGLPTIATVAAVRALTSSSFAGSLFHLLGWRSTGDGAQGDFWLDASDTSTADNGGTVLKDASNRRWKRFYAGYVNALWFGLVMDANPATAISAGGYGVSNVTAINSALRAAYYNYNYPANVAGGGYGGKVEMPGGYAQIDGTLPIIVNNSNQFVCQGEFATNLLCLNSYHPSVTMADGSTMYVGAIYFTTDGLPFTTIPGYPASVERVNLGCPGGGNPGAGLVINANTFFYDRLWISGFYNGIIASNENTESGKAVIEFCQYGLNVTMGANGNDLGVLTNECYIGASTNNRPWLAIAATGNTGGTSPVVVIAANQGLNTGYTFDGNAISHAVWDNYQVKVMGGTGVGQTGHVQVGGTVLNGSWQFVLTLTSDSGAWTALDTTSQVVLYTNSMANKIRFEGENNNYLHLQCVGSYNTQIPEPSIFATPSTMPARGAMFFQQAENTEVIAANADIAVDYRKASLTIDGLIVDVGCKNLKFNGGDISGWRNGIIQASNSPTDGLVLDGVTSTGNSLSGASILDSGNTTITGGCYNNNGSASTPGTGLVLAALELNGSINVAGVTVDGLINGANGYQATGISCNVTQTSSTITLAYNSVLNHSTANYAFSGHSECVITDPTVSRPIPTIASAATITLPPAALGASTFVSGTTGITSLTATGCSGITADLIFTGNLTVTDGSNLKLNGNFVATPDDVLSLRCDGTNWYEKSRSAN